MQSTSLVTDISLGGVFPSNVCYKDVVEGVNAWQNIQVSVRVAVKALMETCSTQHGKIHNLEEKYNKMCSVSSFYTHAYMLPDILIHMLICLYIHTYTHICMDLNTCALLLYR